MSDLVIFDLGGVLVRGIGIVDRMADELAVDRQALKADYLLHLDAMMAGLFPVEAYYRHLEERFHVKVEGDLFRRAFKPTVNGKMVELADTLCGDGMRCAIGSNTYLSHWHIIDEEGIREHFDAAYASFELGTVKPYAAFWAAIMCLEGVDATHTHFIDDSPANVEGAARLGIDAWLYDGDDEALWRHFGH